MLQHRTRVHCNLLVTRYLGVLAILVLQKVVLGAEESTLGRVARRKRDPDVTAAVSGAIVHSDGHYILILRKLGICCLLCGSRIDVRRVVLRVGHDSVPGPRVVRRLCHCVRFSNQAVI